MPKYQAFVYRGQLKLRFTDIRGAFGHCNNSIKRCITNGYRTGNEALRFTFKEEN